MSKPVTYASYLKIEELLALQQPLSQGPEHDETLFIVIHQVYELWFKQLLHELDALERALADTDTSRAFAALKRMLTILKTLVQQVDVLETMTPLSFNAFRARLEASSGFQSAQFAGSQALKMLPKQYQMDGIDLGHFLIRVWEIPTEHQDPRPGRKPFPADRLEECQAQPFADAHTR